MAKQSIFTQVALAMAVAEERLEFEHRDLHLGNILLMPNESSRRCCNLRTPSTVFNGEVLQPCNGPTVKLIDFTFSRLQYRKLLNIIKAEKN